MKYLIRILAIASLFSVFVNLSYSQLSLEYDELYIEPDTTAQFNVIQSSFHVNNISDSTVHFNWEIGLDSMFQEYQDNGLVEISFKDMNLCYTKWVPSNCVIDMPNIIDGGEMGYLQLQTFLRSPLELPAEPITGYVNILDTACTHIITSLRFQIGNDLTVTSQLKESIYKVFPNPTNDIVYIESENDIQSIMVKDIHGLDLLQSTNSNNVDISNLPNGIYFLQVSSDSQQSIFRVVKN